MSKRIRAIRLKLDLTQEQMAAAIGLSHRAYQAVETGGARLIHLNAARWVLHSLGPYLNEG